MKEEEFEEIKKILSKEFGCLGTIKPIQWRLEYKNFYVYVYSYYFNIKLKRK